MSRIMEIDEMPIVKGYHQGRSNIYGTTKDNLGNKFMQTWYDGNRYTIPIFQVRRCPVQLASLDWIQPLKVFMFVICRESSRPAVE